MTDRLKYYLQTMLNSYSMVFFSQDKFLASVLLATTFFNPPAGIAGLLSVIFTICFFTLTGYQPETVKSGIYSFNSLLLGIGFGTFYQYNLAFCVWLIIACLLNCLLTAILYARTGKYGLPVLSLPFVVSFWLVLTAGNNFLSMGLLLKNYELLNEAFGGTYLKTIGLPHNVSLFFRALSAVIFQDNVLTGLLMSVGILVYSRIAFSCLLLGFTAACFFNFLTGIYPEGISYYHLGANFMMVALATGSFFLIPSARAFGWAMIGVLITFLLITAFAKTFEQHRLPLLSLPFCIVSLLLLCFLRLRTKTWKLQLTTLQHYSPEANLYLYLNHQLRLKNLRYINLNLPFMGSWKVSQGYNGSITHQGDWAQALDFVITDADGQTFRFPGTEPEHFYAFNKPVLACANGTVAEVVDDVEDNRIGEANLQQNWGNSIVIKHLDGLYSKVSHLKKGSVKVAKGDLVKQGAILGLCGNSGRSPEPHLHFQLQATPYIGSKTLAYPFAYYTENHSAGKLNSFKIPLENEVVQAVEVNFSLKKAFGFRPGQLVHTSAENVNETWEIYTDTIRQNYIYCKETGATAYFINDGTAFYFTSFYGDKNSILYCFFLAAFKVVFSSGPAIKATDQFPLNIAKNHFSRYLQDLAAPFFRFRQYNYQSNTVVTALAITVFANGNSRIFSRKKHFFNAEINLTDQQITGFNINIEGKIKHIAWHIENIY